MNIYVRILNEGTVVYRPVEAVKLSNDLYKLKGQNIYESGDEEWEFIRGTTVVVEEKSLEGRLLLTAVGNAL